MVVAIIYRVFKIPANLRNASIFKEILSIQDYLINMSNSKKSKSKGKTSKTTTTKVVAKTAPAPVVTETVTETPVDPTLQEFEAVLGEFTTLTTPTQDTFCPCPFSPETIHQGVKEWPLRAKKSGGSKTVSGFATPTKISNELCAFMGLQNGTEVARTEVTKYLSKYIKDHSLQDEKNRRVILPDKKLGKLLNVSKTDSVTYFNIQKYMKPTSQKLYPHKYNRVII